MRQRFFLRNLHFRTKNSVNTAMIYCFSLSCIQIFSENPCFTDRESKLFNGLGKTGTHFSGRFPLFKRNPGCSEDFFQLIQSVCIILICQFPRKANCQQIGINKCETQIFMNIFCRCFLIADASLLDVSFQSLRVRIDSDREKCVIYLL